MRIELDLLTNKFAELLRGLHGLQATIESNCRPDIAMSKEPSDGFVVAWPVLEIDRRRRMSELMNRDPNSDRFLNAHGNLFAELETVLRLTGFSRE